MKVRGLLFATIFTSIRLYNKVLFIGLDSAETSLVEKWVGDGSLPNLKKLVEKGVYQRTVPAEKIMADQWITVYSGGGVAENGYYNRIIWSPEKMANEKMQPYQVGAQPFWHAFGSRDPRVIALDIPFSTRPAPFNGIELYGWASHDRFTTLYSSPPGWKDRLVAKFGPAPYFKEKFAPHSPAELEKIKNRLVESAGSAARLAKYMLENEPWDLFMVVFGATHRAGHKLWPRPAPVLAGDSSAVENFSDTTAGGLAAIKEIYQACDRGVGELVNSVGEATTILVFSPDGMGPNTSRNEILPDMVSRIVSAQTKGKDLSQRPKFWSGLRERVPIAWRDAVKKRLPERIQDFLSSYWRMGGIDWAATPVFAAVPSDTVGLVRVNLKGREALGIVEPGEEYENWINIITRGLSSFMDADTGVPLVSRILRSGQLGLQGKRLPYLPDLIVIWGDSPASQHREINSPLYGAIPWPTPFDNPDSRSGNHTPQGFLLAVGGPFEPVRALPDIQLEDIAPTLVDLLGAEAPPGLAGTSLMRKSSTQA